MGGLTASPHARGTAGEGALGRRRSAAPPGATLRPGPVETTAIELVLQRQRRIVSAGLAAICALAWWYLAAGAGTGMSVSAMTTWAFPPPSLMPSPEHPWDAAYWCIMLSMWWVMMIAMMVPSAAPVILLYARVQRHIEQRPPRGLAVAPTALFAAGYLLSWLVFSVVATTLQWSLERAGLMHRLLMWSSSGVLSGAFLVAAAIYQVTPLKHACLEHCRSPLHFLMHHFRNTRLGALRMGIEHGLYCVGCCGFLMVLLFVGGIMNLVWIAGLAILVLLEKLSRHGVWIGRVSGMAMLAAGLYLLVPGAWQA